MPHIEATRERSAVCLFSSKVRPSLQAIGGAPTTFSSLFGGCSSGCHYYFPRGGCFSSSSLGGGCGR